MKNSMKLMAGIGLMMFAFSATGFGQEAVRVEGYKIDPPKAAAKQAKRVKGAEAVTVQGYPVNVTEATAVATYPAAPSAAFGTTVAGFALPDNEKVATQRKAVLTFKGESKPSEVKVKVAEDEGYLKIMVQSSFRTGSIAVEIIDPKGENRGKYMLKTDDTIVTGDKTSVVEEVSGDMQKDFVNPLKGEWIIRAIPVSAEGTINVMIRQESFPGISSMAPVDAIGQPSPEKKR